MGNAIKKYGEEFALNDPGGLPGNQIITPTGPAGFFAVWGQDIGGDFNIWGQYFAPDGSEIGDEFIVNTHADQTQHLPSAATLSSGNIIVTWRQSQESTASGGDGSGTSIKGQLLDAEGNKIGGEFFVNTITSGDQTASSVFSLPSGGFVVTWADISSDFDVRGQVFDAAGAKVGDEFIVHTTVDGMQSDAIGVALDGGDFVIVWRDSSGPAVKGQRFDSDGNKLGGEFFVSTTGDSNWGPDIAAMPDGGFVVGWQSLNGTYQARAQRFDSFGNKVGAEVVASTPGMQAANVSVTTLNWGGFMVAWENETPGQSGVDLRGQLFDAAGAKLGSELIINTLETQFTSRMQLDTLASGDVIATWTKYFGEGAGIKAQILRMPIVGTEGVEELEGSASDDFFLALGGDDILTTFAGDDYLDGGAGADAMSGGQDDDLYIVDDIGDAVTENSNEGTDEIRTSLGGGDTLQQRRAAMYQLTAANVENLTGTSDLGQGLRGNSGDNIINAAAGDDYIDLTDGGSDTVNSGNGRDVLYYGAALDAGDANDAGDEGGDARGDLLVVQGNYSAELILGADALVDIEKLRVLKAENTSFGHDGTGQFDYFLTTVDANVAAGGLLVVQGGSLQVGETLIFNGSDETDGRFQIFGGRDADQLFGGSGDDHFLGRAGDDLLIGNGGNDRLRGGLGRDILVGGGEADTFIYAALPNAPDNAYTVAALESTGLNHDVFGDFNFAEDKIDLPQAVASLAEVLTGALSSASFDADLAAAVDGALQANGAVLFTADAGDRATETFLVIDADGDGAYQVNLDFVMELENSVGAVPAAPDFFV